ARLAPLRSSPASTRSTRSSCFCRISTIGMVIRPLLMLWASPMFRLVLLVCLTSIAAAEPTRISIGQRTVMGRTRLLDGRVVALDTDGTATVADRPTRSLHETLWWSSALTLRDGRVLVTGGTVAAFSNEFFDCCAAYDPKLDLWEPARGMSVPRVGHTA